MIDESGKRYGLLTVIGPDHAEEYVSPNGRWQSKRWTVKCRCDCGNITHVRIDNLRGHHTRSCGSSNCRRLVMELDNDGVI